MPVNLMQTNVDMVDANLQGLFNDLQGNIVKGHGRDFSRHVFLRFVDSARCRAWLRAVGERVTTARAQYDQAQEFKQDSTQHLFTGLMLSASGYRALGFSEEELPDDKAFRAGMKDLETPYDSRPRGDHMPVPNPLYDDIEDWEPEFREDIHAALVLAAEAEDAQSAEAFLEAQVELVRAELGDAAELLLVQHGHAIRNERGQVIEHFGFVDGISNPQFLRSDLMGSRAAGGFKRHDSSAYLGLVLARDPNGGPQAHGSFFVYRKLQQNIRGFHEKVDKLAGLLTKAREGFDNDAVTEVTPELAGAMVVGRFADGTPLGEQQVSGWATEPNNFDYDHDGKGRRVPLASHCRKTNPRTDTTREFGAPPNVEYSRRIVRRAISYGSTEMKPEQEWTDAGLLFLCCQSNIEHQFIFMQHSWSNNPVFLEEGTGIDPISGAYPKGTTPQPQKWPARWGLPRQSVAGGKKSEDVEFLFTDVVRTRGGEYFFAPSPSFLKGL